MEAVYAGTMVWCFEHVAQIACNHGKTLPAVTNCWQLQGDTILVCRSVCFKLDPATPIPTKKHNIASFRGPAQLLKLYYFDLHR